jgi:hypothetical protein
MRSIHKRWPERSIATVAALALMFASIVGAYGHAGHGNHRPVHAAHAVSGEVQAVSVLAEPAPIDGEHEGCDIGNAHCNCFMCQGGHAILAQASVIPYRLNCALVVLPTASVSSTPPNPLERPPRPSVFA